MNINEAFPSSYIKASDLQGKKIKVTIDRVEMAEFDDGSKKPALYFTGKEKGMIVNRTNARIIEDAYGPETDGWTGWEIVLYPARVEFKGQMVDALRVEIPRQVADDDDSVPF